MGENEFSAEEREVFREDETNSFWWIGFEAANTNVNMTIIKGIAIKKFSGAPNTTKSIRPKVSQ